MTTALSRIGYEERAEVQRSEPDFWLDDADLVPDDEFDDPRTDPARPVPRALALAGGELEPRPNPRSREEVLEALLATVRRVLRREPG